MQDRFTRSKWLFKENFEKLQNAKVLVCGVGGVGGICTDALARAGVGDITIIDKDTFDITNQNRQIYSEAVGAIKVEEFAKKYKSITAIKELMTVNFIEQYDFNKFDIIIDAIDDMKAKVALAHKTHERLISSMGGGKRVDATKIKVTSIWKTHNDALARKFRSELKKSGFKDDFEVVFSTEDPLCKELGSFMGVTGVFGLNLASLAVRKIINS